MNRRKNRKTETSVVADLKARVQDAKALQSVTDQDLLADPRLNPATRARADRLQAERLATGLETEHRRELRAVREADRRAEEHIRAAAAVDAARAATDESYTVLDLVRSRTRFSRLCLGASIVLSVGSAMGLEAATQAHISNAPDGIGYLGEIALTGMSTTAILWAGKLARAEALPDKGRTRTALIALIAVPLLVSIVGSTIGSGPVGAIASLGAAAFSAMAYLVATTSAAAITALVDRIDGRTRTTVTEVPADNEDQEHEEERPLPRRSRRDRDALDVVGEEIADQAADYLRSEADRGDDDGPVSVIPRGDDGSTSVIPQGKQGEDDEPEAAPPALESAAQRRARTARERVRSFYDEHPGVPVKTAAKALGMDPKTVRKYHPDHADGGAS